MSESVRRIRRAQVKIGVAWLFCSAMWSLALSLSMPGWLSILVFAPGWLVMGAIFTWVTYIALLAVREEHRWTRGRVR